MAPFFKLDGLTVSTSGLRFVHEQRASPTGGAPYKDRGILTYEDGTILETSLWFARALSNHLAAAKGLAETES